MFAMLVLLDWISRHENARATTSILFRWFNVWSRETVRMLPAFSR